MSGSILVGDALAVLRTLPDASVQCCVTSPPYWGLRDYGVDGQIGLEQTPGAYVAKIVDVFGEVRRVLRDDATCWVNLGDSYSGGGFGEQGKNGQMADRSVADARGSPDKKWKSLGAGRLGAGIPPKNLIGIPWSVAFALRNAGWYLRSDIIWHKPNPMPESVTDRPTKAHEYVFLLSKSERYYYDIDAIREPHSREWWSEKWREESRIKGLDKGWNGSRGDGGAGAISHDENGRNARTVWTITSEPFTEAHFACFPEALPQRCILAGSRIGDTILDPFCGSGTTCAVADAHQRSFIGIELNPQYAEMARRRVFRDGAPLFSEVSSP